MNERNPHPKINGNIIDVITLSLVHRLFGVMDVPRSALRFVFLPLFLLFGIVLIFAVGIMLRSAKVALDVREPINRFYSILEQDDLSDIGSLFHPDVGDNNSEKFTNALSALTEKYGKPSDRSLGGNGWYHRGETRILQANNDTTFTNGVLKVRFSFEASDGVYKISTLVFEDETVTTDEDGSFPEFYLRIGYPRTGEEKRFGVTDKDPGVFLYDHPDEL